MVGVFDTRDQAAPPAKAARSDAFVFFGATGDLAFKEIFPALARLVRDEGFDLPIIGVARHGDVEALSKRAADSLAAHGISDEDTVRGLTRHLRFVQGSDDDPATFASIRRELGQARHPLHYLAIPPNLFATAVGHLKSSGSADGARVIVEKPFGRNLATARQLNATIHQAFDESAIFRIDHYLGKEQVQNLVYFRFANSFLEPIWNRNYVRSVEINMPEDLDVSDRASFYDPVGAIRDVVQNHLLQVVSLLAMEAPAGRDPEAVRSEKFKAIDSIRPLTPSDVVRGQYRGYGQLPGVARGSTTETYVAMRLLVDTWRWAGVPFYIRTGKCLPVTVTEVRVDLRQPPVAVFGEKEPPDADYLRFRLTPDTSISLGARAKRAGEEMVGEGVELYAAHEDGDERPPYQRLIGDAAAGDQSLFAREAWVEAAWRVVEGVLDAKTQPLIYRPGTWGPKEASSILLPGDRWHDPTGVPATPKVARREARSQG